LQVSLTGAYVVKEHLDTLLCRPVRKLTVVLCEVSMKNANLIESVSYLYISHKSIYAPVFQRAQSGNTLMNGYFNQLEYPLSPIAVIQINEYQANRTTAFGQERPFSARINSAYAKESFQVVQYSVEAIQCK
jgi:hypothetical protein